MATARSNEEDHDRLPPGIYEFHVFNKLLRGLKRKERSRLHRRALFDSDKALTSWLTRSNGPDDLAKHLNEHIRTDPIGPVVAAAAWLGLRAARRGKAPKFFLRVGHNRGARVGVVDGEFVAVVVEVGSDWPHLDVGLKGIVTDAARVLIDRYEQFERDAISMDAPERLFDGNF